MAVTSKLLDYLRGQLLAKVDHAQYRIGTTFTTVPISEKKLNANGTVTIGFHITADSGTVNLCRLRDAQNNVLASRAEEIVISGGMSAVYYFFTYNVYELVAGGD